MVTGKRQDKTSLALTYTGDYGLYVSSDDDDYDDHTFSFDAEMSPSDVVAIDFGASYGMLHDNRGEVSSEGIIALTRAEPDDYDISNVDLELDFGRESAMLGFCVKASQTDIEYQNNRSNTVFRDRDETCLAARAYGKLSGGKTKFFIEVSDEDFSYDETPILGGTLDSNEQGYAVGVEWEATGKTTGAIKIGEVDKDFDAASKGEESITVWDVDVTWSLRTYSHVLLSAANTLGETNGTGDFIESTDYTISWLHAWSEQVSTTISLSIGEDDYIRSLRSDDRESISVSIDYDWKRWVSVGEGYSYRERDSNNSLFDYEKNVFTVNFDMSM